MAVQMFAVMVELWKVEWLISLLFQTDKRHAPCTTLDWTRSVRITKGTRRRGRKNGRLITWTLRYCMADVHCDWIDMASRKSKSHWLSRELKYLVLFQRRNDKGPLAHLSFNKPLIGPLITRTEWKRGLTTTTQTRRNRCRTKPRCFQNPCKWTSSTLPIRPFKQIVAISIYLGKKGPNNTKKAKKSLQSTRVFKSHFNQSTKRRHRRRLRKWIQLEVECHRLRLRCGN